MARTGLLNHSRSLSFRSIGSASVAQRVLLILPTAYPRDGETYLAVEGLLFWWWPSVLCTWCLMTDGKHPNLRYTILPNRFCTLRPSQQLQHMLSIPAWSACKAAGFQHLLKLITMIPRCISPKSPRKRKRSPIMATSKYSLGSSQMRELFESIKGVVSSTDRHRLKIRHPGYDDPDNVLLDLLQPAIELEEGTKCYGLDIQFVLMACGVVAGNRWDGWLSESKGSEPETKVKNSVLLKESYYFHVPGGEVYSVYPYSASGSFHTPKSLIPGKKSPLRISPVNLCLKSTLHQTSALSAISGMKLVGWAVKARRSTILICCQRPKESGG